MMVICTPYITRKRKYSGSARNIETCKRRKLLDYEDDTVGYVDEMRKTMHSVTLSNLNDNCWIVVVNN